MKSPLLLALVFIPFVHGCGCESGATSAMKKRPKTRLAGAWVDAPAGARWRKAAVEVEITSTTQTASGRQLPIETTTWSVQASLVLEGGAAAERVPLAGGVSNTWDTGALVRAADGAWKIRWAPDGRGVALLADGAEGWLWVCCDAARPFHCPHLRVGARGEADPGAKGPRLVDLALEMMGPPDGKGLHPTGPDQNEWLELAELASWEWYGPLAGALADAALRENSGLRMEGVEDAALRRIQNLVSSGQYASSGDPQPVALGRRIRALAAAALTKEHTAGSVVASNAALLLANTNDRESRAAMASALLSEDWAPPASVLRDGQWPRALAWSLARSVNNAYFVDDDVESSMIVFLKRAGDKPESALPILFMLAKRGSPKAREVLEAMAQESDDPSPPAWPASLDELWKVGIEEHGALTHGVAAWAKAAMAKSK